MLCWMWFCPEACSPPDLGKDAAFWAKETAWAPAWEEPLEQTVPLLGWSFVIGQMGGMWLPAPSRCGKKLPACL